MKFSITHKINLLSGSLIFLLGLFLSVYFLRHEKRALIGEIDERAKTLLHGLASGSEYWVLSNNEENIAKLAKGVLEQKDVIFCEIQDIRGKVLFQGGAKKAGPQAREYSVPIIAQRFNKGPDEILIFNTGKEESEEIGKIRLAFSLADLDDKLRRARNVIGLFIFLSAIIAFFSGSLLIKFILGRPINSLISGTTRIGQGDLSYRVALRTQDELGQLAAAFNHMTENLEKTTVSRDELAEEIVERKRMEAALRLSEERFQQVAAHSGDWIWEVDAEGRYTYSSPMVLNILGYKPEEIVGKHFHDFFTPGEKERLLPKCQEAFARKDDLQGLLNKNLHKDGHEVLLETTGVPILDAAGQLRGYRGVDRDITERKKLEALLIQSEKLSAVGQLAAGIAHEINNPLGIILGFSQSALTRIKETDALALPLNSVAREALRCKELVQNLLVFSRAQKNERREPVDLNFPMESALSLILAQSKTRNVTVVKELGAELPKIQANNVQLQQILINLANNAMDAMPQGGTLTVRTALSSKRPGYVEIQVRDTGDGIPQEIQAKIFDPFFTTKEVGKGTGLGLALVYEIVQKHEGAIELASAAGQGTTFTIYLPAQPPTA